MRSRDEVRLVERLAVEGLSKAEIVRATGIPYRTISHWLDGRVPNFENQPAKCAICAGAPLTVPTPPYVYLLGLYLGDGCVYHAPKGVYRLGIFCSDDYPAIMDECEQAIAAVLPNKVGRAPKRGCVEVYSYSKHWPCMFPQHGPGMKHTRKIELTDWQQQLVDDDPRSLLRGLIHSDGTRFLNRAVGTAYPPYPRYQFTNASSDIRAIFERACDALGIQWRYSNARTISIARRASVAILDSFIGPKQ